MRKFTKLVCCFNSLTTNTIEILIIILSSIGLILSIIGIAIIPWGYTNTIMEVLFLIVLILFIYSLTIPSIILCLRKKNYQKIDYLYINSLISIILSLLCIFFNIYIAIGTIPDLKNKKLTIENVEISGQDQEIQKVINTEQRLVSKGKIIVASIVIVANIIIWLILLFLWISEFIRLKYKIIGSYNDYSIEQKNIPIEGTKRSEFNIIGHDKYGFPLYKEKRENGLHTSKYQNYFNYKINNKYDYREQIETNNILKYSYKEKYNSRILGNSGHKSVDVINKIKNEKKEKYIEKYSKDAVNPYYSNFENRSVLNFSTGNNSINPGI